MSFFIALASAAFGGWLAHRLSKGNKAAVVGGVVCGLALVFFYKPRREVESRSPVMHIEVPANFKHDTVVLITDPNASAEIAWSQSGEGRITSPKSGIIRVKDLGPINGHESGAQLSDGRHAWGMFNSYIDGAPFLVYDFNEHGTKPEISLLSDAEVVRYFRQRESE